MYKIKNIKNYTNKVIENLFSNEKDCSHLFVGVDLPEVNMRHRVPEYQRTVQAARQELLPAHPHLSVQHCFICRPSHSTVSEEDAGIEPRTVATSALATTQPHTTSHPHQLNFMAPLQPENKVSKIKIPARTVSHWYSKEVS